MPHLEQPLASLREHLTVQQQQLAFAGAAAVVLYVAWKILRQYIMSKYTAVPDLKDLPKQRTSPKLQGTCFIAGGSLGGLLAASVCAKHFEKVVVVESEDCHPDKPRKYILQSNQLHTYFALVTNTLEGLYPDIKDRVRAEGGRIGPFIFPFYLGSAPNQVRKDPDNYATETIYLSRAKMENMLRRLVAERHPNVELIFQASVTGVEVKGDRITHALVRKDNNIERYPCNLFLDCTGPALGSLKWLPKVGYKAPKKLSYDPGVNYASAVFDLSKIEDRQKYDPDVKEKDGFLLGIRPACGESRASGFLSRIENDTLLVSCNMWNGPEGLPKTINELPQYFADMPHWPEHIRLLQHLVDTQPDTPLYRAKPPTCYRIEWPTVDVPSNFIPAGDTVHKLNAQYGAGISQASVCATTLNKMLFKEHGRVSDGFSKRYIKRVYGRVTYLWDTSRLTDYGWANTVPCEGETLQKGSFDRWLQSIVIAAMCLDPEVSRHVYDGSAQVMNHYLLEVLNPRLIYWILRLSIFGTPKSYPPYNRWSPRADLK